MTDQPKQLENTQLSVPKNPSDFMETPALEQVDPSLRPTGDGMVWAGTETLTVRHTWQIRPRPGGHGQHQQQQAKLSICTLNRA